MVLPQRPHVVGIFSVDSINFLLNLNAKLLVFNEQRSKVLFAASGSSSLSLVTGGKHHSLSGNTGLLTGLHSLPGQAQLQ